MTRVYETTLSAHDIELVENLWHERVRLMRQARELEAEAAKLRAEARECGQRRLAAKFEVSPSTIQRHVKHLVDAAKEEAARNDA